VVVPEQAGVHAVELARVPRGARVVGEAEVLLKAGAVDARLAAGGAVAPVVWRPDVQPAHRRVAPDAPKVELAGRLAAGHLCEAAEPARDHRAVPAERVVGRREGRDDVVAARDAEADPVQSAEAAAQVSPLDGLEKVLRVAHGVLARALLVEAAVLASREGGVADVACKAHVAQVEGEGAGRAVEARARAAHRELALVVGEDGVLDVRRELVDHRLGDLPVHGVAIVDRDHPVEGDVAQRVVADKGGVVLERVLDHVEHPVVRAVRLVPVARIRAAEELLPVAEEAAARLPRVIHGAPLGGAEAVEVARVLVVKVEPETRAAVRDLTAPDAKRGVAGADLAPRAALAKGDRPPGREDGVLPVGDAVVDKVV